MTSENDITQKARTAIIENDLLKAEEILLEGISNQEPILETYNILMEVYFRRDMFEKVAEYFKEATIKFPNIDLNSYLMIANHLFSKSALNETELILYLALQNHIEQRPIIANKLMELYLHPKVPGVVAYNFIKDNFNLLSLSAEMTQEVFNKLTHGGATKEHKDFYLLLFAISVDNTAQKEFFTKQYLAGIKSSESALTTLEELVTHSNSVEVSIYLTFATILAESGASEISRKILALAETKIPEEAETLTAAQILISNAPDPSNITTELFALVEDSQLAKIAKLLNEFELSKTLDYIKTLYPIIGKSKQPLKHYALYSQALVCNYYKTLLKEDNNTPELSKNQKETLLNRVASSDDPYIESHQIIDILREHYESIVYPDREQWKQLTFTNTNKPIEEPIIGILKNALSVKTVQNVKSFNNKFGLYDQDNKLIPETFHFTGSGSQLKPYDAEFTKPVTISNQEREFTDIDEPVLFLGYTFHGYNYGSFLIDGLNTAWYLAENNWEGKVYFQFLVDNAPSGAFGTDIFKPQALELLELAGIDSSQILLTNQDINFKEVVIPEVGYRNNSYGYKKNLSIFNKIADEALRKPISENVFNITKNSKAYLSRSRLTDDRRLIIGEELLEKSLTDNGFSIVHPQELSVTEQIQVFNKVDTIVGTMGSAMHTILFCQNKPSVHTLCPGMVNINYTLTNTLVGITEQFYHDTLKTVSSTTPLQSGYHAPNFLDIEGTLQSLKNTDVIPKAYQSEASNATIDELVKKYIESKNGPEQPKLNF